VHPVLGVLGVGAMFAVLAMAGASGDAAATAAYLVPLSAATLATGAAVIRRGRGPAAGLLLALATAFVWALVLGALLVAFIALGAANESLGP